MNTDPNTQNDFPVDWEEDHYVSRREFFKFLTLAGGGLAVGTVGISTLANRPKSELRFQPALIASIKDLKPGESLSFGFPRENDMCILIRPTESEFFAYKQRCTHLSCPVEWRPDQGRLTVPAITAHSPSKPARYFRAHRQDRSRKS